MHTLFTIGHSNRAVEDFIRLLLDFNVQAVADVRSHPKSRFNPHFDRNSLSEKLKTHGISYVFLGKELGARRTEKECYANGTVDYDLVKKLPAFAHGILRVRNGLKKMNVALMCAERDPLTCHRTILVARELKSAEFDIHHILSEQQYETQEEVENRLLNEYKSTSFDLFISPEAILQNAYKKRGMEIAYAEDQDK